jgi:single-stranded-DNA-specific exonuclease
MGVMHTSKDWVMAEPDLGTVATLSNALEIPALVACLLVNRGVSDEVSARRFLNPQMADLGDPYLLPDMDKAVTRLEKAIKSGEKIFIHGDYDTDGVTSTALCLRALTSMGANVTGHVPHRQNGYDLQKFGVDKAKAWGASLILTADCGSRAIEAVEYANSLGMEVIITDHHRPGPELPAAIALVNPYRTDGDLPPLPFTGYCGAGVAFKMLDALVERIMPEHRTAFRLNFVDLVALGTVADVTPLIDENRILVTHGLTALGKAKKVGIQALLLAAELTNKPLTPQSISFSIAPRLNAVGRIDDAAIAYKLLTTKDPNEAEQLMVQVDALRAKTQEETARVMEDAVMMASLPEFATRRVLILAKEHWGHGVVGIAAAKLVELLGKPVILLSYNKETDHWGGSARSYGVFNLHEALEECAPLLTRFGGHSMAAGVSLPNANLDKFRDQMDTLAEGVISDEPFIAKLNIDAELQRGHILTTNFVETIEWLAPFGNENEEPVFATYNAELTYARRVGKDGSHLQMRFRLPEHHAEFKAIWFRQGDLVDELTVGNRVHIAYTPSINEFNGKISVDLQMKDIQILK